MAAISYIASVGGVVENITAGTAAPTSGSCEIRIDQTTSAVTDAGSTRAPRKAEILQLIDNIKQVIIRDSTIAE